MPTKLLHSCEGGVAISQDPDLIRKLDLLKNFGIQGEEYNPFAGINGKMSELHAAMGFLNLATVDEEISKRSWFAGDMTRSFLGSKRSSHIPSSNKRDLLPDQDCCRHVWEESGRAL